MRSCRYCMMRPTPNRSALFLWMPFLLCSAGDRQDRNPVPRAPRHGMSIAIDTRPLSASPTWRQFQTTCLAVGAAIGVGCVLYAIETILLHCERRFVENPSDVMTRAIGLAHFTVGWLFLFTSPRLRNRAAL